MEEEFAGLIAQLELGDYGSVLLSGSLCSNPSAAKLPQE